jgi:hypothetical protein
VTSFEEATSTLRVVVPGFLLLRVFYWRGFRTQRTDLELVLWSLALSLPVYGLAVVLRPADDVWTVGIAVGIALVAGEIAARVWLRLTRWRPRIQDAMNATAWDSVVAPSGWVQVRMTDGSTYVGAVDIAADSAQTDKLDLYLREPAYLDGDRLVSMEGAEGLLLLGPSIATVARFAPPPRTPSATAPQPSDSEPEG